jgi:hypothetical protein
VLSTNKKIHFSIFLSFVFLFSLTCLANVANGEIIKLKEPYNDELEINTDKMTHAELVTASEKILDRTVKSKLRVVLGRFPSSFIGQAEHILIDNYRSGSQAFQAIKEKEKREGINYELAADALVKRMSPEFCVRFRIALISSQKEKLTAKRLRDILYESQAREVIKTWTDETQPLAPSPSSYPFARIQTMEKQIRNHEAEIKEYEQALEDPPISYERVDDIETRYKANHTSSEADDLALSGTPWVFTEEPEIKDQFQIGGTVAADLGDLNMSARPWALVSAPEQAAAPSWNPFSGLGSSMWTAITKMLWRQ